MNPERLPLPFWASWAFRFITGGIAGFMKKGGLSRLAGRLPMSLWLACAGLSSSCSSIDRQKSDSFEPYRGLKVGGQMIVNRISSRGCVLNSSGDADFVNKQLRELMPGESGEAADDSESISQAIAVTSDGYYLTAAHCVESENGKDHINRERAGVALISLNEPELRMKGGLPTLTIGCSFLKARIVKRFTGEGLDLAIVKTDSKPFEWFSLGSPGKSDVGESVITVTRNDEVTPAAGRVIADWGDEILTSVPIKQGDSGGGLTDESGNLVGVNSAFINAGWSFLEFGHWGRTGVHVRIGKELAERITGIIQADRKGGHEH